jgi:CubicO group peptidase (beta-lactamase class C family)
VRHLLHHTSGLRDYLALFDMAGLNDFPITNQDFLAMMARQRGLNFPAGEQYSYSNSGYVLLSIIVDRVSGKSLRAFAEERMFRPLGMTASRFRDRHQMLIPHRADAYRPRQGGGYDRAVPYFDVVGDGGLFTTVEDLARWADNFADPRVGGATWVTRMEERGRLADGTTLAYASGLGHGTYRGEVIVEHGGGLGGYNSFLLRFPQRRFAAAVLCNSFAVSGATLARQVADVFLGDVLQAATPTPASSASGALSAAAVLDPAALARYAGTFFSDRIMDLRQVVAEDGRLSFKDPDGNRTELVPQGGVRFLVGRTTTVVQFSRDGDAMRIERIGQAAVEYRRVSAVTGEVPQDLAGSYTSPDLDVRWRVTVSGSTVTVHPERGETITLSPVFADAFSDGFAIARFVRDARGAVVAMEVSAGERARRVRFDR